MANVPLKVGFVGCGGISKLYTAIYAGLGDIAQVVAVADPIDELAERRRQMMKESYLAAASRSRVLASDSRTPEEKKVHQERAEVAEAAAKIKIKKYRSHEELLKDEEIQVMVLLTPPFIRGGPVIDAAEAGRHVFTEGPMARSVEEADAIVEAVSKAGIKYHPQCVDRYIRGIALGRLAVESGHLGNMGCARIEMNVFAPQSYYRRWGGLWEGEGGGAVFGKVRAVAQCSTMAGIGWSPSFRWLAPGLSRCLPILSPSSVRLRRRIYQRR